MYDGLHSSTSSKRCSSGGFSNHYIPTDESNGVEGEFPVKIRDGKQTKAVWKKILYENQPFEDNYTDPLLFLNELKRNSNMTQYKSLDVIRDSVAIVQNISVVVQFLLMFSHVLSGTIRARTLVAVDALLFVLALPLTVSQKASDTKSSGALLRGTLRQALSLGPMLMIMSPLLSALTVSYTDDTIVAMSILVMTVHVLATDYPYLNGYSKVCDQNFGVNAGVFGVILMVSRIPKGFDGITLLTFGAICFLISPFPRHTIRCFSFHVHLLFTVGLSILLIAQLWFLPAIFLIMYVLLVVLLILCIPWCFIRFHESSKVQINGPWDEAKPTNSAAAAEWANSGLLS